LFGLHQTILSLRLYFMVSVSISGIIYAGATSVCTLNILLDTISAVLVPLKAFFSVILSQNELLTYLWYLNLRCTLRGLEVIQKFVRCSSYWGGSPQNGLRDEQTCETTLASAYVLCHLSTMWLQLQIIERSLKWKWVLIGVLLLNTGDRV